MEVVPIPKSFPRSRIVSAGALGVIIGHFCNSMRLEKRLANKLLATLAPAAIILQMASASSSAGLHGYDRFYIYRRLVPRMKIVSRDDSNSKVRAQLHSII